MRGLRYADTRYAEGCVQGRTSGAGTSARTTRARLSLVHRQRAPRLGGLPAGQRFGVVVMVARRRPAILSSTRYGRSAHNATARRTAVPLRTGRRTVFRLKP